MFENIIKFFKNIGKSNKEAGNSKEAAKERLHLVLMQDRANVSADFLDLMKQEIIEVIKKYIDVDESAIDVRLANKTNEDGTTGSPALYANIPIRNIKEETRKMQKTINQNEDKNNVNEKNNSFKEQNENSVNSNQNEEKKEIKQEENFQNKVNEVEKNTENNMQDEKSTDIDNKEIEQKQPNLETVEKNSSI